MQTHSKIASTIETAASSFSNNFKHIWNNMKSNVETRVQTAHDMYNNNIRGRDSRERMSSLAAMLSAGLIGWAGTKVVGNVVRKVVKRGKSKNLLDRTSTN